MDLSQIDTEDAGRQKERAVAVAKRRLTSRAVLAVVIVAVAVWAVRSNLPGLAYFLAGGDAVDLGDVRTLRASGKTALDVAPGSYVRLRNLMVTHPAQGKKFNFFFCPIFNVLVRTPVPLPEDSMRVARAEVTAGLEYLLEQRKVFVEDFANHFDAEGWLVPLREAPGWNGGLKDFIQGTVHLPDRDVDQAWALLDREPPGSHYWEFVALLSAFFVTLAGLAGVVLAWKAYRRAVAA